MGFYIRKALTVGPFRFNLSKSGIGVSAGMKGLRLGSGPRGNYVHMGRHGLYYRKMFHDTPTNAPREGDRLRPQVDEQSSIDYQPMQEIESGDVSMMVDSSSAALVDELNSKRKKAVLWPYSALIGAIAVFVIYRNTGSELLALITALFLLALTTYMYFRDQIRKSTVIFFELEDEFEQGYQGLHDSFDQVASCGARWHIEAEGQTLDRKRNAGASKLLRRNRIQVGRGNPEFVKTNVFAPSIPVGRQTLYFYPDKILVFDTDGVGAVSYSKLRVLVEQVRFIEEEAVPHDAEIVGRTWKYVNKDGGPDRRFNDNRELPIARYEDVLFTSDTGLNEKIELSRIGAGQSLWAAIDTLAKNVEPTE